MKFLVEYVKEPDKVHYGIVNSINTVRAIQKFEEQEKIKATNCWKIIKNVYELVIEGKNKVNPNIKYTTRVELNDKEFITKEEAMKLCDADSLFKQQMNLKGYRILEDEKHDIISIKYLY